MRALSPLSELGIQTSIFHSTSPPHSDVMSYVPRDINNARTLVRWPAGHGVPESHAHIGDFFVAVSTSIPILAMAHCCFYPVLEKKDLPAELCLAFLHGCTTQPFLSRHLCLYLPSPLLPSSKPLLPPTPISLHLI